MMVVIKNRNIDDVVDFRIGSVDHRAREWLRKNTLRIAERVYGDLFKNIAFGQQLSERYADSLEIKLKNRYSLQGKPLMLKFTVNYFDQETGKVPLSEYFEYGTRRHFIAPVKAKALRWNVGSSATQSQTTTSRFASGSAGENVYAFSKGHFVSGIKPRRVLYWTLKRGNRKFTNLLARELKKFLKATSMEIGI